MGARCRVLASPATWFVVGARGGRALIGFWIAFAAGVWHAFSSCIGDPGPGGGNPECGHGGGYLMLARSLNVVGGVLAIVGIAGMFVARRSRERKLFPGIGDRMG